MSVWVWLSLRIYDPCPRIYACSPHSPIAVACTSCMTILLVLVYISMFSSTCRAMYAGMHLPQAIDFIWFLAQASTAIVPDSADPKSRRNSRATAQLDRQPPPPPRQSMTTVSPFARSSVFDEPRLGGREQTVSRPSLLRSAQRTWPDAESTDRGDVQRPGELPGDRGAQSSDAR